MATKKRTTPARRTTGKADTVNATDVLADIESRAADMEVATSPVTQKTPVATFSDGRPPAVLSGMVVEESVDPNAERALRDPAVATDYNAAKVALREYGDLETRRTESLKRIARSLMDLRAHFKEPGSKGRRVDWNGKSREYEALATLLYRDAGLEGPTADSAKRAVRHHVEDVKREMVPKKQWEHYGVQALTRGQRAQLTSRFGKAHDALEEAATSAASRASSGQATGAQLVALAKRIDAGMSVYSMASLRALSTPQRRTFRDQLQETRERADALLRELEEMEA